MTKDIEFYKKQEVSLLKRMDTLKQEIDKLLLKNNELKEKFSLHSVVKCFGKEDLRHVYEDLDTGYESFDSWFEQYILPI